MQRTSVIGEVFGYLVCLLAVVIFFISVAGVVNGAFRVVNPDRRTARHRRTDAWRPLAPQAPDGRAPRSFPGPPDVTTMRANFVADARFDAVRRLVLAIVMFDPLDCGLSARVCVGESEASQRRGNLDPSANAPRPGGAIDAYGRQGG